ncbi:RelA/SpoT family protein [Pontivivens ytuae]|uniref:GTP pyrophosphokinase rsh n=1 Tax=Pontivivens ytuae TaxID=2789856 RepID=A0A7S9LSI6_9RHOB|nr:bifunctional (p)ppGpp synthetase/guanosine-3',5'-bis(diphosphate) 3'-pyrophosphohydrolase [Pontivivens ytuae]QPH54432.1 bifunctional (p)ppGpp synthetase/guanosine-3',5'-bis(diphosphate) 3'-pyrophosphohydrolase [Pontivivens ytuae]
MPDGAREPHPLFRPGAAELAARVRDYNPHSNSALIEAAYAYALKAHDGQTRRSGEPYFTHPLAVAEMLAEQQLDDATIATALLHDTVEDTGSTHKEVSRLFGQEIAELVNGVTKLTNLELNSKETKQAENFHKLLMAVAKDLRVLLVKLNDRLHNMRTIRHMRPEKQVQKAEETMDIYAPLAGRMGMQWMREELEDLSFKVLQPEGRSSIMRRFITLKHETGDVIPKIVEDMRLVLSAAGIPAEVTGREKKPYSIWRKLQEKDEEFHRLSDIFGFRIITRSEEDCYRALGVIHRRWTAVPGRFKDYISQPKSNGYRSIHTTVSGRSARRVEIQIRTREMHEVNETGVAAHWSYRDGIRFENPFAADPVAWLKDLNEGLAGSADPSEFLEHVKLEMFQDQVFCFTPKGKVVKLPRGATPLDFAYAIHTNLGNSCVGAKVDNRRVPLFTRLRNGQSVTIISAPGQKPQASWADLVVTGRAKTAIRRFAREEEREALVRLGREFARVAFEKIGKKATDKALATAAERLGLGEGAEDVLRALGATEISGEEVVSTLYPELTDSAQPAPPRRQADGVIGLDPGQAARAANCCEPLPGERIVGITWRGRGVEVHSIDCPTLVDFEDQPERWVDLRWGVGESLGTHAARLCVTMANDAGVLGRLCSLIGEHNANISDIRILDPKPDFYVVALRVEVRDLQHLLRIETAIEADSAVTDVVRQRNSDAVRTPASAGI